MTRSISHLEAYIDRKSIQNVKILDRFVSCVFDIEITPNQKLGEMISLQLRIGDSDNFSRSKKVSDIDILCNEKNKTIPIYFDSIVGYKDMIWIIELQGSDKFCVKDSIEVCIFNNNFLFDNTEERYNRKIESGDHFLNYSPNITRTVNIGAFSNSNLKVDGCNISAQLNCGISSRYLGDEIRLEARVGADNCLDNTKLLYECYICCDTVTSVEVIPIELEIKDPTIIWILLFKEDQLECSDYKYVSLQYYELMPKNINSKRMELLQFESEEERYNRLQLDGRTIKNYFR